MKTNFTTNLIVCGFAGFLGVTAQPARASGAEGTPKPAMKSISPQTAPDVAVPGPMVATDVWVNTHSKIYHCPGNRWYGRTPVGAYMSEVDAKAKGYKAEKNHACPPAA